MAELTDTKPVASLPGGRYRAAKNEDGTWNLYDVPIMAAGKMRLASGDEFEIDRGWLEAALAQGQRSEREGYAAPLHVNHHETGEAVEAAGQFVLRAVREGVLEGNTVAMLYADLIRIQPYVYDRIRAGALPYRSFEAVDVREKQVTSLALMAHQPPRFKLPLLLPAEGPRDASPPAPRLAIAAARTPTSFAISAEDNPMPEDKKDDKPKDQVSDDKKDDKGPPWAQAMMAVLSEMSTAMKANSGTQAAAVPSEPAKAPPPGQPANLAASAAPSDADLRGRLIAMEGKVVAMEQAAAQGVAVSAGLASLKGFSLGPSVEADLRGAFSGGGQAELDRTLASIRKHAAQQPTADGALGSSSASGAHLPDAVLAYGQKGPDALAQATKIYAEIYRPLEGVTSIPLDRFLSARMNPIGARSAAHG